MSAKYNITINKGETFTRTFTWKDGDNNLINLTGYTARMHIRENIDDSSTIIELTTENGRITLGGVAGTIVTTISATDTASIDELSGVYDIELIASGGVVKRFLEGEVLFTKEVTR